MPCGAEIHFLHYLSPAEARGKWQRRCARLREAMIAGTPLYLKFCDFLGATDAQFARFHAVPFGTKVSFGVRPFPFPFPFPSPAHAHVPRVRDKSGDRVPNGARLYLLRRNHCFDIVDWIRDGTVHRTPLSRLLGLIN